jgi:DNA replication ATP-dependent helicase Dna2
MNLTRPIEGFAVYALSKRTLSQYVRGECRRRLRLDLYAGDATRKELGIPVKDVARPGLALLVEQGRQFEREKFGELAQVFAGRVTHGAVTAPRPGEESAFGKILLDDHLDACGSDHFLVEAEYVVTDPFIGAHGLRDLVDGSAFVPGSGATLRFAAVRPDILQVVPPAGAPRHVITPSGEVHTIAANDPRLGLRIIDIKLTGEPSPSHFAELAYYGMTLAAWLERTGRDGRFVVLKDAAVWPGKHEASEIRRREFEDRSNGVTNRSLARYLEGLGEDLETMPAEVVLGRVRRFFAVDLREAILAPDWQALPWHVDSGCSGCDYLGYSWKARVDDDTELPEETPRAPYCWSTAEVNGHLSRVVGLTRGACGKLKEAMVESIAQLAALRPGNPAFEEHQKLRAGRALFHARSGVLTNRLPPEIPEKAGTSAELPARSDIKVALSVDFDVGSGLTFAIGYQILTHVPAERVVEPGGRAWFKTRIERGQARVMLVEQKSLDAEREVLTEIMRHLVQDIDAAAQQVEQANRSLGLTDKERDRRATLQVYLWDRLNYDHLRRVMGRHLLAVLAPPAQGQGPRIAPMAWMFPADQIIEDADFTTVNSPISLVGEAIQALLAADVPHHYSLLGIANAYHPPRFDKGDGKLPFRLNPFFQDPLSDQIPSERGHEVWNRRSPFKKVDYQGYRDGLKRAVRVRLDALLAVTERLTDDLKGQLSASAPTVRSVFDQTQPLQAVSRDGEIIYQHARLMAAADELEINLLMAMPPHQREAVFKSVRLEERLDGPAKAQALASLGLGVGAADPAILVFRMSPRSVQARIKVGEFNWSLMPESALPLQHRSIAVLKDQHFALRTLLGPAQNFDYRRRLRSASQVSVLAFERVSQIVVLRADDPQMFAALEQADLFDFAVDGRKGVFAILDPLPVELFLKKRLKPALKAIRVPPLSVSRPLFPNPALTRLRMPNPRQSASVPAERFIWDADTLAGEASGRSGATALAAIAAHGYKLTQRQSDAVRQSVEKRLSLLWGPPGTGKSTPAVALILGLLREAQERGAPLRLAITGPTWVAIDTVARKIPALLRQLGLENSVRLARLASSIVGPEGIASELQDHIVITNGSEAHQELVGRLEAATGFTIVAGTAHQLSRLIADEAEAMRPFFDFMLIDEASQMSVAHAVVAFTTLAEGASLTVVGDDLQMPPIQPIAPPEGAEHLVGSIYDFFRQYRNGEPAVAGIQPVMLDRSYRSNKEIVDFVRLAGYGDDLTAENAGLRMRLASPLPGAQPADWPASLPWHGHLATLLDPEEPLTALIHPDEYSSQRNDHEANLVAGLVRSLYGRLLPDKGDTPLSGIDLFKDGLGIVTPHRAQQAAVVERLMGFLPTDAEQAAMIAAVDTVERFQGQEKTVMIASFGLGDRDQIAAEEEFLYSLNRFNVIASRAKAKLIVIVSRRLVDHLPRDPEMLRQSRLLKHYADGYLLRAVPASIPALGACEIKFR